MPHSQEDVVVSPLKLAVVLASGALALLFHVLVVHQFRGIGLALFGLAAIGLIETLVSRAKIERNRWAYLFLGPFVGFTLAIALYASDFTQFFVRIFALGSFLLYAYWLTAPRVRWSEAPLFWTKPFITEGVLPAAHAKAPFLDRLRSSRHGSSVLFGVVIALPVLLVLSLLFASADPVFAKIIEKLIPTASEAAMVFYGQLLLDAAVLIYALRYGWLLVTRQAEDRKPVVTGSLIDIQINLVTFATVLILVNALFALFLLVQLGSMFGDVSWMLERGMTYAERARQGFFQLIFAGGVTGALLLLAHRFTGIRERLARGLSYALIAQVLLVLVSAARRLGSYIDAYGWTEDRVLAMVAITLVFLAYLWFAAVLLKRLSYVRLVNVGLVGVLGILSLVFLVNWDGFIAKQNVDAFFSGHRQTVDVYHLQGLSLNANKHLYRLATESWPVTSLDPEAVALDRENLLAAIERDLQRAENEQANYPLGLTFTEWLALRARAK